MANSGNGGIIGVSNVVVNGCAACATASGVWELNTVYDYIKASDWVYNFASLDYLVIAGGGSSGGNSGGGGGAGGMLSSNYSNCWRRRRSSLASSGGRN